MIGRPCHISTQAKPFRRIASSPVGPIITIALIKRPKRGCGFVYNHVSGHAVFDHARYVTTVEITTIPLNNRAKASKTCAALAHQNVSRGSGYRHDYLQNCQAGVGLDSPIRFARPALIQIKRRHSPSNPRVDTHSTAPKKMKSVRQCVWQHLRHDLRIPRTMSLPTK